MAARLRWPFVGMGARGGPRWAPSRLDHASCSLTWCGVSSVAEVRVVLVMWVVAHRRLGPTISANTRCAVRFSPDCLSVQAYRRHGGFCRQRVTRSAF